MVGTQNTKLHTWYYSFTGPQRTNVSKNNEVAGIKSIKLEQMSIIITNVQE